MAPVLSRSRYLPFVALLLISAVLVCLLYLDSSRYPGDQSAQPPASSGFPAADLAPTTASIDSAATIFDKVVNQYSVARSYEDSGCNVQFQSDGVRELFRNDFHTRFVRNGNLRFESVCGTTRSVDWTDGKTSTGWVKRPVDPAPERSVHNFGDFATALVAARSGGLDFSPVILLNCGLLNRKTGKRTIHAPKEFKELRDDVFDGRAVWVIVGITKPGEETQLSVDKASLAILCIESSEGGRIDSRTVYRPQFDIEIAATAVGDEWDPP